MGWIVLAIILAGMYYWGRASTQCSSQHRKHGRCQLKPGHFPQYHRGRDGGGWR